MNRDDVTRWAREADFGDGIVEFIGVQKFERFAALVAAAEREACAEACEEVESRAEELWDKFAYPEDQGMASGARQCATAIRARGEK